MNWTSEVYKQYDKSEHAIIISVCVYTQVYICFLFFLGLRRDLRKENGVGGRRSDGPSLQC